jgi:branched-chain amino acid transport system ATP-binding protein
MLKVNNMQISYGGAVAVHDVSFYVKKGEFVSIIGSNGAGKTTTAKGISGLIPYRANSVLFDGERIDRLKPHEIVHRGIIQVPEGKGIFGRLTVRENLLFGAFYQRKRGKKENMEEILEMFPDLRTGLHRRAGMLSGGQQQMLAIARALMFHPKLLVLDEPSMGVMPTLVEKIFETIKKINREGITILLIEQRVKESLEMAHRGYVMQTGKVVLEGNAAELLKNELIRKHYLGM